ncbi:MAG: hypothetical protein Q7O66_22690, partial [Dehalococcoidia bacterium]|nr:hypothetical protein [Dehalococcoidia bacterium]
QSVKRVYSAKFFSEASGSYVQAGSVTISSDPAVTWIAQGAALDSALGANWVSGYDIGDDTKSITGLSAGKKMIWVGKKDGQYYVDGSSGRAIRVFEAFPVDDSNGVGIFTDSMGRVWYPSKGGLLRYNPVNGAIDDVTPGRGLSHDSAIYGRMTTVAQYKGWFYVSMYNGTTSYVMVGRDRGDGEQGFGAVVWHGAIAKLTGQISHFYVNGQTSPPRLYMAAGTTVAYIRLDSAYRYAAAGSLYFPADTLGTLASRWHLAGFVISCTGFNSATYADIFAKIDNGDWQPVNRLQASGRVFIPIPAGDWRFTELTFRFDFVNAASAGVTPEIWAISMLATQRVYTRPLIQASLICSKRVLDKMGIVTRRSGRAMVDALEALAIERPVEVISYLTGERRKWAMLIQPIRTRLVRFGEKDKWEEWGEVVDLTMVAQSSPAVRV